MGRIEPIDRRGENTPRLLEVWETAVEATHTFLNRDDIRLIKPEVEQGIAAVQHLYGFFDDDSLLQGFIGVDGPKTEMLFVHAGARGRGIGKQLLAFALRDLDARYVDVNEQNAQGVGFYRHMGFVVAGRSNCDDQGRPFPILHLVYEDEKASCAGKMQETF